MKKFHFLFLSVFFLAACSEETPIPDPYDVPAVFQPYVDRFVEEGAKRGVEVNVDRLKVEFEGNLSGGDAAGTCTYTDPPHIRIDSTSQSWTSSEARREVLMFHELGHCILNRRDHRDDKMTNQNFASIMRSINFQLYGDKFNEHKREYYLDELFNTGVSFPDWAVDVPSYNSIPASSKRATFLDDFSDNRNNWNLNATNANLEISGGNFKLENRLANTSILYTRSIPLFSSNDFEIEIRYRILEADQIVLFLWGGSKSGNTVNEDHYYIGNASQNVYLGWRGSGTSAFYEIDWVQNGFNTFTIRKIEDNYYFYINEQLIDNGKFEPFFANDFGFIVGPQTTLEVEYLNVYEID